jgi:hypothetical protein
MVMTLMATPGVLLSVSCAAAVPVYDASGAELRATMDSFRHKGATDSSVNAMPASAAIAVSVDDKIRQAILPAANKAARKVQSRFDGAPSGGL